MTDISDERKMTFFIHTKIKKEHTHYINSSHFHIFHYSTTISFNIISLSSSFSSIQSIVSMHVEWLFLFQLSESFHMYRNNVLYWWTLFFLSFICQWNELLLYWNRNNSSFHWLINCSFLVVHYPEPIEWLFLF